MESPSERSQSTRVTDNMVLIAGGSFRMGSDQHYPEEAPAHTVRLDAFWIDRHAVTNEQFARFVDATGHVTLAERPADPLSYPDAKPELLAPASSVFKQPAGKVDLSNQYNWWFYVLGADWRHPHGPESSLQDLEHHPVVHVAFEDAAAYARWMGKELPTEAQWEFAARGGLEGAEFAWLGDLMPQGRAMANTWQGEFPWQNLEQDGFAYTAPVGSFPPNGHGLYEMTGNVWEWTTDWYQDHGKIHASCCTMDDPRGGGLEQSYDPFDATLRIPRKVMKGGSFLCAPNYCQRYRPAARMPQAIDTATCHLGFRCVSPHSPA